MPWYASAWEWLKKNWKWLLLPIGLLLWFIGRSSGKREVTVTSTALGEHEAMARQLDAEAAQQKATADAKESSALAGIAANQSAQTAAATQKQIDAAAAAEGDPYKVNSLLLDVGKDMRK